MGLVPKPEVLNMPQRKDLLKIGHYIELVLKKRWFIIIPFCLAMIVGSHQAITLPKTYEASTLILIEPQSVPQDYVRSVVTEDIDSRISTIQQQIMSRTNLEKIIRDFNLFLSVDYDNTFMEDKIVSLRKRIEVKVTRTRRGADAFSISYRGRNPEKVMRVANGLATYFMDENLKVREAQAMGTSDFLEDELVIMKKRLVKVEQSVRNYRQRNMGELPEQLESNLRVLDRLQLQLSEKQQNLRDAKNRLILLENQIKEIQNLQTVGEGPFDITTSSDVNRLKQELESLKSRYTDSHPDVIRLEKRIEEIEADIANGEEAGTGSAQTSPTSGRNQLISTANFKIQREEIIREIKNLEFDIPKIDKQIELYQQRVERTPEREEELSSLMRDYTLIRDSYNSLLNRKLEAEIAVNMERKQKGEQFRIIDRAMLPEKPVSPDMKKLFLIFTFAGLGIGCALILLQDYLDTSMRQAEEFEEELGLTVLATIPQVLHPKDIRRRRFQLALSIFSIMIAGVLFAGFAVLTIIKGVDPTLEFVKRFISI
jgi:polysaccharide chain length determinant protein (PEP-CTERM system associated)